MVVAHAWAVQPLRCGRIPRCLVLGERTAVGPMLAMPLQDLSRVSIMLGSLIPELNYYHDKMEGHCKARFLFSINEHAIF